MSIANLLTKLRTDIANAYTAVANKEGTIPSHKNTENLAEAINSISASAPINNQDKTITANGAYMADSGYTGLGTVTVNVPEGSDVKYGATIDNIFGNVNLQGGLIPPSDLNLNFVGVTNFQSESLLSYMFYQKPWVKSVSFPDLTSISPKEVMFHAFDGCTSLTEANFPKLRSISNTSYVNQMSYAFANCTNLKKVDLSSVTTVCRSLDYAFTKTGLESVDLSSLTGFGFGGGSGAFANTFSECTQLEEVILSSLTTIPSTASLVFVNTFYKCTSLTDIDLSALESIAAGYAMNNTFQYCSGITSVNFPSLTSITGNYAMASTFADCSNLEHIYFPYLSVISGSRAFQGIFARCNSLSEISFPSLTSSSFGSYTDQFKNMLTGVANTSCTIHFPSNLQSVIGNWTDVVSGFGAASTATITVLFDLPATE